MRTVRAECEPQPRQRPLASPAPIMARPFFSVALCGLRAFAATWAANWVGAYGLIIFLATCQLSLPAQANIR